MAEVFMAEEPTVRDLPIRIVRTAVQDLIKFSVLVAGRKSSFKSLRLMIKNSCAWNVTAKNRDVSGGRRVSCRVSRSPFIR